ncbi:short-chain dehydrogenase [Deinococcus koreensis]|uniref:Short-chain dehydrogenase n=2 Tax=Deinococcus koreensis TaxID=2054903 RepID=A0A2K3USS0_9DEIO|nr:short-chain dehydrogenase [Deinococcus koreensis]
MVITGASSGIGLSTARRAAGAGAKLILAARSEGALNDLVAELKGAGAQAVAVVADVSREEDVRQIAQTAQDTFGGFDTWVNNAGVGMYGRLDEVSVADMRRVFDINYWGLVYGSLEAVRVLRERGGALINVGSTVSERAIPLQGTYAASKHAIKGFTDALRMELEDSGAPVSVTLIKPGPIDTPFPLNARNYLPHKPQHVPPVYAPETVARAILHAAAHPVRDVSVGSGGRGISVFGGLAPRATDRAMEGFIIPRTESAEPPRPQERNALEHPSERLSEHGDYPGHVQKTSSYTAAALHPGLVRVAVVGAGLTAALLWRSRQRS